MPQQQLLLQPLSSSSSSSPPQKQQHTALRGNSLLFAADFFASWSATTIAILLSHPVDTARIRQQTHRQSLAQDRNPIQADHVVRMDSSSRYLSPHAIAARAKRIRSLYNGLLTPMITSGPIVAVGFSLNELYQRLLCRAVLGDWRVAERKKTGDFRFVHFAFAGSFAGATAAVLQAPISVVRITQQIHDTRCLGEKAAGAWSESSSSSSSSTPTTTATKNVNGRHSSTLAPSSSAASAASTTTSHSHTSNNSNNSNSLRNVARRIFRQEGLRGFYRGFPLEAAQAAISRLIYFSVWEKLKVAIPARAQLSKEIEARRLFTTKEAAAAAAAAETNRSNRTNAAASASTTSNTNHNISHHQPKQQQQKSNGNNSTTPIWTQVVAGTLASWSGWATIYPLDSIKSRVQGGVGASGHLVQCGVNSSSSSADRARSIVQVAKDVYHHHGVFNGLYRGFTLTMLRGAVSSGTSLPLYESLFKPKFRELLAGTDSENFLASK